MQNVKLYMMPGTVSRPATTALEHTGIDYEMIKADPAVRETEEFRKINPQGKVPALVWNDRALPDSSAIVWFLYSEYPEAGILPTAQDGLEAARILTDLTWASGTLHALVARLYAPQRYTVGEDIEPIREDAKQKLAAECKTIQDRVGDKWWYGDQPTVMDAYLTWAFETIEYLKFDLSPFPGIKAYVGRVNNEYPCYKRAGERENSA